jgi:type IV pilus assembly protein PilO
MATPFREWPWPMQAVVFLLVGVAIVIAGLYTPGLPVSKVRADLEAATKQLEPLKKEVNTLQTYERRRVELQGKMEALKKQLETLQTIVPEEKQVDEFIRMLQGTAAASNVSIRRLTTKPVVAREYHYEMPFELEADGSYYALLDFFTRLGRLSRIINVGDLSLKGVAEGRSSGFRMAPGTSITGTMTVTTFFTKSAEAAGPPAEGGVPLKKK